MKQCTCYALRAVDCTCMPAKYEEIYEIYTTPDQEPVAWRTFDGEGGYDYRTYDTNEDYADEWEKRNPNHKGWVEPLYKDPKPCPTCEALARTVMLDQTSHDTTPPQRTEPICPECKAEVLYECVACSNNNYPPKPTEQEPAAWIHIDPNKPKVKFLEWKENEHGYRGTWIKKPLYLHPTQRTEQNFCSRCGKRTPDLTHIHTCTPPREGT